MLSDILTRITRTERRVADLEGLVCYGTVTQVSPLRIRLDGDDEAIPATPARSAEVAAAIVGSRVVCLRQNRRLVALSVINSAAVWARVEQTAAQSIPDASWTSVSFASRSGESSGVTLTDSGLTVLVPGVYSLYGQAMFDINSAGNRYLRISSLGVVIGQGGGRAPDQLSRINCAAHYRFAANAPVELQIYQNRGGSLSTSTGASNVVLSCAWVGP